MIKPSVTILYYGAGNIKSVTNALDMIGAKWKVTSNSREIVEASKIIMPGVGSAKAAMEELQKRWLVETIRNVKAPFLGICLGMQLLFDYSEERDVACLGIIKGRVRRFQGKGLKVPQIGWNRVKNEKLKMKSGSYFYFVHSYYCVPEDGGVVTATTEYGVEFASAVQYKNFYGVQFHPEKSGEVGLEVLKNFCEL